MYPALCRDSLWKESEALSGDMQGLSQSLQLSYAGGMDLIMSVLMLASLALFVGGLYLVVKRDQRKQGGLMMLAAVIMVVNIALWMIPMENSGSPIDQLSEEEREGLR